MNSAPGMDQLAFGLTRPCLIQILASVGVRHFDLYVEVEPTICGGREGRDEILEKGIEVLKRLGVSAR